MCFFGSVSELELIVRAELPKLRSRACVSRVCLICSTGFATVDSEAVDLLTINRLDKSLRSYKNRVRVIRRDD